MSKDLLHKSFCKQNDELIKWYSEKSKGLGLPIYSSYDIRDAGFKISNVDANIYPAGFNNICNVDKESAGELFKNFIDRHYGAAVKKIMLITEEHTQNPYYWDNIYTIKSLLEESGRQVYVAFPKDLPEPLTLTSASGKTVQVNSGYYSSESLKQFSPDLIISNNDFSLALNEWQEQVMVDGKLRVPINPPRELGWYQRQKSRYFHFYNQLVEEFCAIAKIDPFLLNVRTDVDLHFEIENEDSRKRLADKVNQMLAHLKVEYQKRGIQQEPFVFVKNNAGTYGLAVIRVQSPEEVLSWSYKSRKKMKAAKGGRDVEEVIIQEGIPSVVQSDNQSAEPVIYMVGCSLAGGFLRVHGEKSATESLNSPGAVYKRLCVSELNVKLEGSPLENVYGWSAKLGMLAIALEAKDMEIQFQDFKSVNCDNK